MTTSSDELLKDSKILETRQLYTLKILYGSHKNKIDPKPLNHASGTKYKQTRVDVPKREKTVRQRNYQFVGAKLYNALPI